MSSSLRILIILVLLVGCGRPGGNPNAPSALDDACAITDQRRDFLPAFRRAQDEYGVPVAVMMSMMWQESKFKSSARTPHKYALGVIPTGRQSSAFGYAQVLDGTWEEYQQITGRWRARRDNIYDAAQFMGWYMDQSNQVIGLPLNDTRNQYLAYHEGRTGYKRGTWRGKSWLINVANKLQDRAIMYHLQLQRCGKL